MPSAKSSFFLQCLSLFFQCSLIKCQIRPYTCRVPKKAPQNATRLTNNLNYLIMATDATPNNIGGYCIDVANKICEFYSFATSMLPKCLQVKRRSNSAEFEMNNLAFALLYWEPLILERRRLQVHTDNNGVRSKGIDLNMGEKSALI